MSEHPICLNCGATYGAHNPDDPDGCPEWWPSTMGMDGDTMTQATDEGRSLMAGTPANRRAIAEAKALAEASQKLGERIESRDDR